MTSALIVLGLAACSAPATPGISVSELEFSPAAGAVDVVTERISVRFPVPLQTHAINGSHLIVQVGGVSVSGTVASGDQGNTLIFVPEQDFAGATLHTVTVSESVPLASGQRLRSPAVWSFTTARPSPEPPTDDSDYENPDGEDPGDEHPDDEQPNEDDPGKENPGEEEPDDEQPGEDEPGDEPDDEQTGDEDPDDEEPNAETAPVEFIITSEPVEYDGQAKHITVETDPEDVDFTITYIVNGTETPQAVNAGTYDVLVESADPAFTGTASSTLVITPRPIQIEPHSTIKSIGEDDPSFTYSHTDVLVDGDSLAGALERMPGEEPGSYEITLGSLSAGPNYAINLSETATLEISPFQASTVSSLSHSLLRNQIHNALKDIATAHLRYDSIWAYGTSTLYATEPTDTTVASDLAPVGQELQITIDTLTCESHELAPGTTLNLRIYTSDTACGEPLPTGVQLEPGRFVFGAPRTQGGNQTYALPFVIIANGSHGDYTRRIITHGEYQFVAGRRSYARYALFTNTHGSHADSRIWFTGETLFDGPVHTNGHFAFADDPWFGGPVTSAGAHADGRREPGAYFYTTSEGMLIPAEILEAGHFRRAQHAPVFTAGIDLRADYIPIHDNHHDLRYLAEQAGILIRGQNPRMQLYTANHDGDWTPHPEDMIQYIRIESTQSRPTLQITETYRITREKQLQQLTDSNWTTVNNDFNGVIYAEGFLEQLDGSILPDYYDPQPAIAEYAQLTLVASEGVRITDHLLYARPPCSTAPQRNPSDRSVTPAECNDLDTDNVLGIVAPTGDIIIGNNNSQQPLNAPPNVMIHATLMASTGSITVENYQTGAYQGVAHVLGGLIQDSYGAFGTFVNGRTGVTHTGYNRAFTYDPRFEHGLTPPYFPTLDTDNVTDTQTLTGEQHIEPWTRLR